MGAGDNHLCAASAAAGPLYQIRDWKRFYEVSDSRKVDGPLSWVALRTKQDGFGFRRLASEDDRSDLLSAWILIIEIAARQPRADRGKLVRDGRPLTPKSLATMTGWPEKVFVRALAFFSEPEQGWLETAAEIGAPALAAPSSPCVRIRPDASGQSPRTGQDITGQDMKSSCVEPAGPASTLAEEVMNFPVVGKTKAWPLLKSKVAEYQVSFPGMDVSAQLAKARQWAIDNPAKRKTAGGMPKFLFGWLERAQNRAGGASTGHLKCWDQPFGRPEQPTLEVCPR